MVPSATQLVAVGHVTLDRLLVPGTPEIGVVAPAGEASRVGQVSMAAQPNAKAAKALLNLTSSRAPWGPTPLTPRIYDAPFPPAMANPLFPSTGLP